jgi:adenine deaminase
MTGLKKSALQQTNNLRNDAMTYIDTTKALMNVAQGSEPADLVINGGRLFNVFTGELLDGFSVAVKHQKIAYVGRDPKNGIGDQTKIIHADGKTLIPGLIDGHTHIAWMFTAENFLKHAMTGGTTTIITEIFEPYPVCGNPGVIELMASLKDQPIKIFTVAPAMVSISHRTRGICAKDLQELLSRCDVLGLGESYWQGILQEPDLYLPEFKEALAFGKTIEGHSAGASEKKLNAYTAAGVSSCHEPIKANEALDRLRLGLHVMVREGSVRKELNEISKIKDAGVDLRRLTMVSDGLSPSGIIENGYMECIVQKAIDYGFKPEDAIRMATLNIAEHFSLDDRIGAIAPGRYADILIITDLETIQAEMVISSGKIIAQNGKCVVQPRSHAFSLSATNSVKLPKPLVASDFTVNTETRYPRQNVRVIEMTTDLVTREKVIELPVTNGCIDADVKNDILKISAIDRAIIPGDMFTGFIKGFGLESGAFACSASWDAADIIVVGTNDKDMAMAVNRIHELQGGVVVVNKGNILEELPLPIFGVMSDQPVEKIAARTKAIQKALADSRVLHPDPLLTIATLTSAAIPFFKICEEGYVRFKDGVTLGLFTD